ncbi:TolC family protein [Maribacter arcticus]|uniref:Outer membrane protein TolC n=1 Tax=Maribacter arcticus TaxID=561365 RepID=A0A1T5C1U6_9FLAO|nr:TolC family protein [Maribacter arcticus]SKB53120.1 Outer membrane protein TolC [Maribacter arcticus]|tara:strand:+ start:1518 stop:2858 length:1341 start_codon:yes stop_codon:yes gene_type:complete
MRNQLTLLLTLLSLSFSYTQEQTYSFTLEEAIQFALENNYAAINADRDIIDAQKQKWETIAGGLPQINGDISYQNQLKQPVSVIPAEIFGGEPGTFAEVVFGQPQTATATATLRQQIFDGSYIVGVQATKAFLSYSANNKEKTTLEVRKQVVEAYGNVLLAKESVQILEKNKVTLEKNLYETSKLYENGLGEQESVDQLQITLSSIENQLQNAIRLQEITLQMLNLSMGLDLTAPTKLKENLEDLTVAKIDLGILNYDFNLNENVDFKLAENLNQQRYYEWKLAKSRALPTLNAFVNYGSSAFSDNFSFLNGEQQWFDSSVMGFDLSIPIFSSLKRSASTQRAKIALEKAKSQLTEAEQQIRLQLENAKNNYTLAIANYETAKQNLTLSERIENKNQIKYKEGLATSFELRQAQTQLYTTQQEFLQSMVEVINKKTELEIILNTKA